MGPCVNCDTEQCREHDEGYHCTAIEAYLEANRELVTT